jgi:hypothetical protein
MIIATVAYELAQWMYVKVSAVLSSRVKNGVELFLMFPFFFAGTRLPSSRRILGYSITTYDEYSSFRLFAAIERIVTRSVTK